MKKNSTRRPRKTVPLGSQGEAATLEVSLQPEIEMLRALMRRVNDLVEEGRPPKELLPMLDTMSMACSRLAGMLKAQRQLSEGSDNMPALFNQALSEVIQEMRITDPSRAGQDGSAPR